MTQAQKSKRQELMEKAESLGIEGIDKNFPTKAIEMLIAQAEKRVEIEKKAQKKTSTARSPRQKFIDLASGSVAQAARLAIDNPTHSPEKDASGTEKSMVQYTKKVLAILYRDGALSADYTKHLENCLTD